MFLTITLIVMLYANTADANLLSAKNYELHCSGYQRIENTQVPADVLRNVSSKYNGYVLNEAFSSGKGIFKLTLNKAGKTVVAYYKSTGEFIKLEAK
jgi:hypothetical protein